MATHDFSDIKQHISTAERSIWNKVVTDFEVHLGSGGIVNHRMADGTIPGFSTNDFTNPNRIKLDGIEEGALNNPHPPTHQWTMIEGLANIANTAHWNDMIGIPSPVHEVINRVYDSATVGGIRLTLGSVSPSNPQQDKEIWIDTTNLMINIFSGGAWVRLGAVYR